MVRVIEKSEKASLKSNIEKMKIMASGPITLWQIDEETVETVADLIFGGHSLVVVCKFLTAMASLWSTGSRAYELEQLQHAALGLSCCRTQA